MRVAVCGWYFFENPKVLEDFKKVNEKYPVFVVSHRTSKEADEMLKSSGLDYWIKDNTGAEFGAYDWYLKNRWDSGSGIGDSILFMHDDVEIEDVKEFDRIAELKVDHAYVFQDEIEDGCNQHQHGRMIFLSAKMLKYMLEDFCTCEQYTFDHEDKWHNKDAFLPGCGPHNGFWYDRYSHGHTMGRPPIIFKIHHEQRQHETKYQSVRHYNSAINHFDWQMRNYKRLGFDTKHRFYCPGIWLGRRNMFRENKGDGYYRRKLRKMDD